MIHDAKRQNRCSIHRQTAIFKENIGAAFVVRIDGTNNAAYVVARVVDSGDCAAFYLNLIRPRRIGYEGKAVKVQRYVFAYRQSSEVR